jgi:cytochrome P450
VNEAVKLFRGYIRELLQDRRTALRENLLSDLLIAADGIA